MAFPQTIEQIMGQRAEKLVSQWSATIETGATLPLSGLAAMISIALVEARAEVLGANGDPWAMVLSDLKKRRKDVQNLIEFIEGSKP